jgi:phosphate starvation-inducible PhoH-like protein
MPYNETRPVVARVNAEPLVPKNAKQEKYLNAIKNFDIVFGVGSAGAGKSFIALTYAADMLKSGLVDKIVLTRPNVEVGSSLGFLPGTKEEKYAEFLLPVRAILNERLGKSYVDYLLERDKIEAIPLGFMRGTTLKNCICVADEMENCTPVEMKMLLTRVGIDCKLLINGDTNQKDIPGTSGLVDAINRVSYMPFVKVITFTPEDSVRSRIVTEILRAYDEN